MPLAGLVLLLLAGHPIAAQSETGVIRLRPSSQSASGERDTPGGESSFDGRRRGFDHGAFEARLESLWFQRKTLLADGRDEAADRQAERIRAFCAAEGVRRLEHLAGALIAETDRFIEQGHYQKALASLKFAESLDPGRPQIRLARAAVYWKSGKGPIASAGALASAVKASFVRGVQNLSLFSQVPLMLIVGLAGAVMMFSTLMLAQYQIPFRHEVGEWLRRMEKRHWAKPVGWCLLLLPLILWFGTGWVALYWIVIMFRFMSRPERVTAVSLLLATLLLVPGYRVAVMIYGMAADPMVRSTLASARGEYDPDRILKLQRLVEAYPEDPVYRFLLAGLFKSGRYFEEAFTEYKEVLKVNPNLEQAQINIGNIFHTTAQYSDAIAYYNRVIEQNPNATMAYYNLHLSQSAFFRFKEADESLARARALDPDQVTRWLAASGKPGEMQAVVDATLKMASVWDAAIGGRTPTSALETQADSAQNGVPIATRLINPISVISLVALMACGISAFRGRVSEPARRCIRCGQAFCRYCRASREGREYCTQCLHLFVRGESMAPEAKRHKLYEVERHERLRRIMRKVASALLPGSAQLLRGRALGGTLLVLVWLAALIAWQPIALLPLDRLIGLGLRLDRLEAGHVPSMFGLDVFGFLALATVILVWFIGNAWRWRGREA